LHRQLAHRIANQGQQLFGGMRFALRDGGQPQIGFVDKRCCLERLSRFLMFEFLGGQLAQLVVD